MTFKRLLTLASFLLPLPLAGQFIGYALPQTVTQTVFLNQTTVALSPANSAQPCTPTNGNPCAIPNLGQSVHNLTYSTLGSGAITQLNLRLEASFDASLWFPISDEVTSYTSNGTGSVVAFGYYPFVRVHIQTLAGTTPKLTVYYSGTVTPSTPYGNQQSALTWKGLMNALPANANQTVSVSVFGVAGGYLNVFYGTATCPTSTLSVNVTSTLVGGYPVVLPVTTLAASANMQSFYLPSQPATQITFAYTTGGACGANATISMEYGIFNAIQMIGGSDYATPGSPAVSEPLPHVAKVDSSGSLYTSSAPPSPGVGALSMAQSTAYEASHVISAAAANFYGIWGYNSKTAAQFIQCFNSTTVPADTTVPIITFTVPAASNFSLGVGAYPVSFSTGISCSNSSTGPTKTIGAADTWFNVVYK